MALRWSMCRCKYLRNINTRCIKPNSLLVNEHVVFPNVRHLQTYRPRILSNYDLLKPIIIPQSRYASKGEDKSGDIKGLADQFLRVKIDESQQEKDEKKKEHERKTRMMNYSFLAFGSSIIGGALYILYTLGSPQLDDDGQPVEDEYSKAPWYKAYLYRAWREVINFNASIQEPSREKLLPEPLKDPYYQPPYTLVLEMTGVLIHPDWTYRTGWRFKKRPGVDYFLQKVGYPQFEVVIYTQENGMTAYPIAESLDPHGKVMYKLFRDATRYIKGHHVKDLSCLNRDPSKVIYIDWDDKAFQLQPENAMRIPKWSGNDDDAALVDLADLLLTIHMNGVEDVRTVLQYYSQFDDPLAAFRENRKKLQEQQDAQSKDPLKPPIVGGWGTSIFGSQRK